MFFKRIGSLSFSEKFRFTEFLFQFGDRLSTATTRRVFPSRQVLSCLKNFDATGYNHLGAGSNESSACEISKAHLADLLNISKLINFQGNNCRIKN